MTVLANASDLAAVGAHPPALLINETLPPDSDETFLTRLQEGIAAASRACRLPVLGGDTNIAGHTELSACAVGVLEDNLFLKRSGYRPEDLLYASGPLGLGNAFAFGQLQRRAFDVDYRPQPRFAQSGVIRRFATCCMDSSDGLISTLDQLMRLNGLGFDLYRGINTYLHRDARRLCRGAGLPQTAMLAGTHGEFELIFTIPPQQNRRFLNEAKTIAWQPLLLGKATKTRLVRLNTETGMITPNTVKIRNMFDEQRGHISGYVHHLLAYCEQVEKEHE